MSAARARLAGLTLAAILLAAGVLFRLPGAVPSFEAVRSGYRPSEARLLDRNGVVLSELRVDLTVRRLPWVPLEGVSPALLGAVVTAEDRRFYRHGGVDWLALGSAFRHRAAGGRARGASTLTMQLAALLDPALAARRGGRSSVQKLAQMHAAFSLEASWSKDQILEAYLNLASFRGELQGVAAAAEGLFGKAPHGLDAADAVVLAALLQAPNATPQRVAARATLLGERVEIGVAEGLAAARAFESLGRSPEIARHRSSARHVATRLLGSGDVREVKTTLDASVQRMAEAALREQLLLLSDQNVRDGAVLVVENETGDVLAWVGSSGSLSRSPLVDGVRARRQAGSTLKPFLYSLAFEDRIFTPSSNIDDAPLEIPGANGIYRPRNYDGIYHGPVPARIALASSLNTPAVRTIQAVGVERFVARLAALGFSELRRPDYYGESVALGSADVMLLELVNAYRSLSRGGVVGTLRLRADDPPSQDRAVIDPGAAFLVTQILSDRSSRSLTFGLESALASPVWSAVKTGTSKDMRDNWCIGFSSRYTVGVWVGNFEGAPMWQVSGVDGAAPAWLEIMAALHRTQTSEPPAAPPGVIFRGGEWYLAGTEPVPDLPRQAAARRRRIRTPSEGAILAFDPDIPTSRQRVFFESEPRDATLLFQLDGKPAGAAGAIVLWPLDRGKHRLELVDAAGEAIDAVGFEVR